MKQITEQSVYLENLRSSIHSEVGISDETKEENERVRKAAESICRAAITEYETSLEKNLDFKPESVELQPFGSTATGFADKASDMDLALLSPMSNVLPEAADSPIPRLLELALLKAGFGAILITGARVPIIKVCQKPSAGLREDLLKARAKWEENYNSDKILKRHSFASAIQPTKFEAEIERAAKSRGVSDETEPESVLSEHVADIDALSQTRADGTVLSIHDYYRLAKKLLSDLGAHDSGLLNSPELTPEQTQTLDDVCRKFIVGLADEELSNKILYSKCFQCTRDKTSTPSKVRSLHSVKNVCEVEIMLKKWPRRALQEDKVAEDIFRQLILNWDQNVLNDSESNSTAFNRQVHHFHDRFSGCPSLKLVMLRQGKDEKARAYHKRASFLLKSLGGNERNPPKNTTLTIVKKAYIDGLYSDSMKRELKEWNKQPRFGLTRLCFLHRTFELIEDWEFGKWNDETKKRLSEYIALLQCGLQTGKKSEDSTSACPVVPAQYRLLKWIATSPQALPPVTIDPSAEGRRSTNRHLEFPQSGVGVQFDINFAAGLAIRNTQLLKCYNACDPRVKEMVLFVKTWAKRRGINKPYYGTLSSYGYVLMVLHFLVNIAQPPVCPNIQQSNPPYGREETEEVNSFTVYFWRDDEKLRECARKGKFTNNIETVGSLLRGFFEYYGDNGMMSHYGGQRCFNWMQQVLTLRSSGGVMTKQTKGWVGAKTDVVKIGGTVSLPAAEAEPEADSGTTERGRASGSGETPVSSTSATPHETAADTGQTPQPEKPENSPKHHDVLIGPMTALTLLNQPRDATPPGAKPPKKVAPKTKEIRNRYLLAIEDPFEITHNVGRTVTHEGICGIRDEFRRALQIIRDEKVHYNVLGEGEERVLGEVSQMLIEERKEGVYGDWKREHQDEGYGIEELMRDWHGAETMKKVMRAKALEDVVVGEK